jgi:hypothetical protein
VKLLFIGDIVGEPGRRAVKTLLPKLREQHQLDFVVANGENSAGGSGITPKTAQEISGTRKKSWNCCATRNGSCVR